MKNSIKYLTALALATLTTIHTTHAGSHTWTGQGLNKNWSLPANWVGDYPPAVGEAHVTLTFPTVVAAARNSTNNLTGLAVDEIILSGSANKLYGNALHLTGVGAEQIVCGGINSIFTPLVLDTGYNVFDVKVSDTLYLSGLISGPGGFTKIGAGVLRIETVTDNSFAGEAKVLDGEMDLKGQAAVSISGPLTIGQLNSAAFPFVFMEAGNQISDNATVKVVENGFLRLNGFSDTVGGLVFQAGGIDTSDPANTVTGVLSLNGNVSSLAHQYAGYVRGKVSLNGADRTFDVAAGAFLSMQCVISSGAGTAGIVKTGMGNLTLHNANTYNGFTKVNAGTVGAYHSAALGTIANGTMVAAGATLQLQDALVGNESLLLNGAGVGGTNGALVLSGTNSWSGTIQLAGDTVINALNFPGYLSASTFSGVINGGGKLTKVGAGTLTLSGTSANTFSGGTCVQGGALVLGKTSFVTAIPGPLIVGPTGDPNSSAVIPPTNVVRLAASQQIPDNAPIYLNPSAYLDLKGYNESIGELTMVGGLIDAHGGMLTLKSNVTGTCIWNNCPTINGNLSLGGATRTFTTLTSGAIILTGVVSDGGSPAGIIKMGSVGGLRLDGTINTYGGVTTVTEGWLEPAQPGSLGSPAAGTVLGNGAELVIGLAFHGPVETLTMNGGSVLYSVGNNSWDGNIVLNGNAEIDVDVLGGGQTLDINGVISGTGNLTMQHGGTLRFGGSSPNTYDGRTTILGSTLWNPLSVLELHKPAGIVAVPGPLIIGSATNPPNHETVRLFAPNQIADTAAVTVNASGLLDLNNQYDTLGSLAGSGNVNLILGALTAGGDNTDTTFSGIISGVGFVPLTKEGTGRMTLTGVNTCSGKMIVNNGDLYVNGSQTCSVQLNANGKLHGQGTVGNITGLGGWTVPGDNFIAPNHGQLKSGNLSLDSTSDFNVDLGGTAASGKYDRLKVTGTVSLANATLHLTQSAMAKTNDQFIIIENDGADAVSGTFNGLAENAIVSLGPLQVFKLSYVGGDGNDVVLTQIVTPSPLTIGGLTKLGGGQIEISGSGMAGSVYTVEATEDLGNPNGWQAIGNIVGDANGALKFTDPDAPNHQMRFYRFKAL